LYFPTLVISFLSYVCFNYEKSLFSHVCHFRIVFWDVLPCKMIVDNQFTRQDIPEDNSEHHTHHCENLKSHMYVIACGENLNECNK
jgi:hypothetical protein